MTLYRSYMTVYRSLYSSHTHTHTHARARSNTNTNTNTHTHTHRNDSSRNDDYEPDGPGSIHDGGCQLGAPSAECVSKCGEHLNQLLVQLFEGCMC